MSGSCSCGGFERSPFGSVLAETWNGSLRRTLSTWLRMFFGEVRVDLVEHVLPVEQRPHLADGFVADARHDAADFFQHRIGRPARLAHQSACV